MERSGYYPDIFERLDQGSRVRSAQIETVKVNLKQNNTELERRNSFENAGNIAAFSLLFVLLAASCSRDGVSVSAPQNKNLPTAAIISQIAEPVSLVNVEVPSSIVDPEVNLRERLELPAGTRVVRDGVGVGCSSDGQCFYNNFYWAPTHEAVVLKNEGEHKVLHELCHAHQHSEINEGASLEPTDYDLGPWYETVEGQNFINAVGNLPWPWEQSAINTLEDFAWTCAYWFFDPDYLADLSPERYEWAAENLP